jgi:2-isopropylmalate synthase
MNSVAVAQDATQAVRRVAENGETASDELVYDWNELGRRGRLIPQSISFFDETLRDGLQNPSVQDPSLDDKLALLHLMAQIGIDSADIGLPGSSQRAFEDVLRMCREVVDQKLPIQIACAGRTVVADILPMVELSQRAGIPIEVYAFIGSSPIRQLAEQWSVDLIARRSAEAIDVAVKEGLEVCYVTEDTTRSRPDVLSQLFRVAVEHGAKRLCLCDTVGHATPDGVRNLIQFTRSVLASMGADVAKSVKLDWHGHNDRGLALVNALWALEFGADRVHGTALGIGERVGNAPMELILLNLKLLGMLENQDLTALLNYCQSAAKAVGWQVPINYPLVGEDAFRTATGVHAAAIIKAQARGEDWLADRIYSGVPAGMFGRRQEICIGYMSGASNVSYWLKQRGIEPTEELTKAILERAKTTAHNLSDQEVLEVVALVQAKQSAQG